MRLTVTKHETWRLLGARTVRDVDALVETHVLIPAAYDVNGQPLFDVDDVRRAAATTFSTERKGDDPERAREGEAGRA